MNQKQANRIIEMCYILRINYIVRFSGSFPQIIVAGQVTDLLDRILSEDTFKGVAGREPRIEFRATPEGLVIT